MDELGVGVFQTALNFAADTAQQFVGQEFWNKRFDTMQQGQKELYEYSHDYTAEMNRLARAGLNPNLVYGQMSGSSPMPGATNVPLGSSNFSTPDIASVAANLSHANALAADADLKNAEAGYYRKMSNRYDDVVNWTIEKQKAEVNNLAHQLKVGDADIRYKNSLMLLNATQERFLQGQIDLQSFQKQNLAAQTILYQAQTNMASASSAMISNEAAITELEAKYMELFYLNGRAKELSDAEYKSALNEFNYTAARVAAKAGIEGSKVAQWTDWILGELGQILGGARDLSSSVRNFRRPVKIK